MLRRLRKDQAGFTLMEIVIVIVILGILALLAVPRLIGFTDQAKVANDKEYVAIVAKSAELYWASHNETFTGETDFATTYATSQINNLVDDPDTALQYFDSTATGTVISVQVSPSTGTALTQTGTGGGTLNAGVALVTITDGATTAEQIVYSSQYGYTILP